MIAKLIYGIFFNSVVIIFGEEHFISAFASWINVFLAYFVLYSFVWRFWCISYDIKWTKYIINNQWKIIINPEHTANEHNKALQKINWYLNHKQTFGNHKWVKWRLLIVAVISSMAYIVGETLGASIFASLQDPILTQVLSSWPYTLPLIFLSIIYCKTPSILDNFYVQTEMKYIFILLCIDYTAFYGVRIFVVLFGNMLNQEVTTVLFAVAYHFVIGAQFASVMISTAWVNAKVTKIINNEAYKIQELMLQQDESTISMLPGHKPRAENVSIYSALSVNLLEIEPRQQPRFTDTKRAEKLMKQNLDELLAHPFGFESFMQHLSREFSMENLLSLVEFLQFQKYVAEEIGYYDKDDAEKILCDELVLSKEVPLSGIVYDEEMDLKNKAYAIYTKYIDNRAEYSINISYLVRQKLVNLMDNYENWMGNDVLTDVELMNIFAGACREIKRLMNDSYQRFKLMPEYYKLANELFFMH